MHATRGSLAHHVVKTLMATSITLHKIVKNGRHATLSFTLTPCRNVLDVPKRFCLSKNSSLQPNATLPIDRNDFYVQPPLVIPQPPLFGPPSQKHQYLRSQDSDSDQQYVKKSEKILSTTYQKKTKIEFGIREKKVSKVSDLKIRLSQTTHDKIVKLHINVDIHQYYNCAEFQRLIHENN